MSMTLSMCDILCLSVYCGGKWTDNGVVVNEIHAEGEETSGVKEQKRKKKEADVGRR